MGVKFTPSPYLAALGTKYEKLKASSDAVKAKALAEARSLTEAEASSVKGIDAEARVLFDEYTALHEAEERDAQIRALRANLNLSGDDDQGDDDDQDGAAGDGLPGKPASEVRGRKVGGATTKQRDPGHYRSVKDGGQRSFFADLSKGGQGDVEALRRLGEHNAYRKGELRVIDTAGEGAGVIPPRWLMDEYAELARQGRAMANAVRNIDLGNDPSPLTLPKQTAGADAAVAEQASEGTSVSDTDGWDSDVDPVVPKPTAGAQIVTRQMLDMGKPATDELIYGDLIGAYNDKVEAKVCAAIYGVGTLLTASDGVDVTDPTHYDHFATRASTAVKVARKLPASVFGMSPTRWGLIKDLRDSTGRLLVPDPQDGPVNVAGVGSVESGGRWHGLPTIDTNGFTDDDFFAAIHLPSILLFEGSILRFRYEQPAGPEKVRLGVWSYTAVLVRYGTAPVKRVSINESS